MKHIALIAALVCTFGCPALANAGTALNRNKVEQLLMQMERDYSTAYLHHDVATIDRILADDYVGIDGRAVLSNKAEEIEEAKAPPVDAPIPDYFVTDETLSEMKVRVYSDAAIVTGLSTETVSIKGNASTVRYRRTTVYVRRRDGWRCVSFHATRINEPRT